MPEPLDIVDGIGRYRLRGTVSLVEAVELIARAIAQCRDRGVRKLLVDATGVEGIPIPSLVDRFLMVEEWAQAADGMVVVALVVHARYIHPQKFGVKVAAHFGLVCDVYTSEDAASMWLRDHPARAIEADN